MADASTEPKLAQTETELATKPLHGDEKAAEAPKETSGAPVTVCLYLCALSLYPPEMDDL